MIGSVVQRQSGRFRIWSIQLGENQSIDPKCSLVTHHLSGWLPTCQLGPHKNVSDGTLLQLSG